MDVALPTVADSFLAATRREGLTADPALRIVAHADGGSATAVAEPADLGVLHERLLADEDRSRRGAWYTPAALAETLVERALPTDHGGTVLDPGCGGGAFLLAAAERLRRLGCLPADAVRRLRGFDIDPGAVAVCEAALWWWSARHGCPTVAGDRLAVGDALVDGPWGAHAAVVGNPPFLGQLRSTTAVDAERRTALRRRYGSVVRPYTDPAWLFLVAAVEAAAPGGRVAMVQPQSLLAARDAGAVRAYVDEHAELVDNVIDDGTTFRDAAVEVCAPVLVRRRPAGPNEWVSALADARGVPSVELGGAGVLGDIATVHAGFRDEYYGMVDAVSEGGTGRRLVTVGAIDPFRLRDRPQRFAGRRWSDPRVDPARAVGRARRWLEVQRGPKVLVATQTRVLEAVADPCGDLVGSVPALVVRPRDPGRLWHVLAVLSTPAVSAWALRRTAGTGLSSDSCRPTAALLAEVPLPQDTGAWDRAADAARTLAGGTGTVASFVGAAAEAYGCDGAVLTTWWQDRLPATVRVR